MIVLQDDEEDDSGIAAATISNDVTDDMALRKTEGRCIQTIKKLKSLIKRITFRKEPNS
jgi:hypothetical protein